MQEPLSATALRANIYRVLDEALETGEPVAIKRKGKILYLYPPPTTRYRIGQGPRRETTDLSLDALAAITWEYEPDPHLFLSAGAPEE